VKRSEHRGIEGGRQIMDRRQAKELERRYRSCLLESVVPFWERYSPDWERGGYLTCLERDGRVFDTDKFMWMQAREVWMFSRLCSRFGAREQWLRIASLGAEFLRRYGRDGEGNWYFSLDREGRPLVAAYNIFSDCFAVLALCEYASVTGKSWAMALAVETYWNIQNRKAHPKGRFTKQVVENRPIRAMALPMIQIDMGRELARHHPDPRIEETIERSIHAILTLHVDEERKTVFERVYADGGHPDCMEGRLLSPGHACEVLWFILQVAAEREDRRLIDRIADILLWTIRRGWDEEHGGIFYYMDAEGFPPEKLEWDMKLWWVHVESLYAFLLAYFWTGRKELLDWFLRIDAYCWDHFDDPEHGEWFGYLSRRGEVKLSLKGGKWKGFFHLPRALMLGADLLGRIAGEGLPSASGGDEDVAVGD